jgi:hypothetical protein
VYEDSYGRLCIAQSQGDAVTTLGIEEDAAVRIEPADATRAEGQAKEGEAE